MSLLIRDHGIIPVDIDDRGLHLIALCPDRLAGGVNIGSTVFCVLDHIVAEHGKADKTAVADCL